MNGLTISPIVQTRRVDPSLLATLVNAFGQLPQVVGVLLFGSRARGNNHRASNADVLLIVDQLDRPMVERVIEARMQAERSLGYGVSVNVHTLADADPALGRWGLFMHKNRAELFVYQAKYTSVVLVGRNVFETFRDPAPSAVRAEAIRVTASFVYFLRKFLFDESMAPHGRAEFVRTPLIALEYLSAFYGYISMGYQDGREYLIRHGRLTEADLELIAECAERKTQARYGDVGHALALRACAFLDGALVSMVHTYRRHGVSDVRWNGTTCEPSWRLDLPQAAAMTVLRRGDSILMLRRPPDDYLYPNRWTIPGGYLQPGESPIDAAARELMEETGLRLAATETGSGEPVISDRLAAFTFVGELSDQANAPRLSEHDACAFVSLDDVADLDLTTEARLVLDRYLASARIPAQKS